MTVFFNEFAILNMDLKSLVQTNFELVTCRTQNSFGTTAIINGNKCENIFFLISDVNKGN